MHITAKRIEADPDDGERFAVLFFAEQSGHYLSLARGNCDDNDCGIEIEINEQSHAAKDAIARCTLRANNLSVSVRQEFQPKLGNTEVVVSLPVHCSALPQIRQCLQRIFRDHPQFEDFGA